MIEEVSRKNIDLNIIAPDSKSVFQRSVLNATLAEGESEISFSNMCLDSVFAMKSAARIGAKVNVGNGTVKITGGLKLNNKLIDAGESAFTFRSFAVVSSLLPGEKFIMAQGSLAKRDMSTLEQALNLFGANAQAFKGKPPVRILDILKPNKVEIDFSSGSQVLSALLTALPVLKEDSQILAKNLKSKGYVDLTISLLERFGIIINRQGYEVFDIPGNQVFKPAKIHTEGDWSGSANFLVAGAIAGTVTISNLDLNSFQPDKAIYSILKDIGVDIRYSNNEITVNKSEFSGFEFDATDCPDLFPILSVLALNAKTCSTIKGVSRLSNKESSRGEIIKTEFNKLGANIEIIDDLMKITPSELRTGEVETHFDHRISMAFAVAGLTSKETVYIKDAECVSKSYPDFYKILYP